MIEIVNRKRLIQSLYEKMDDNEMIFNYFGVLTFDITQFLLDNLKVSVKEMGINQKYARKLYSSMVEGMENILKYSTSNAQGGIVMLTKNDDVYCLTLGNVVDSKQEHLLLQNLDDIKDESVEQLKLLYKERLSSTDESNALSAQLGLIQIAINCENNMKYDIVPLANREERLFIFDIFIK